MNTPVKRTMDVLGASVVLLVTSPLLLVVALAISWKCGSPILFRQTRIGKDGRPFMLIKFRTMRSGAPDDGDAVRLTPIGAFLRRASLDELPQLWNVVRGEMSLVGPRPLLPQYLGRYTTEQMRRHEVLPGITGLAQVSGRNGLSWEQKFERDVWYVHHQSVRLDLSILWQTLVALVRRDGITAPDHATMPEFTGTPPQRRELGKRDVEAPRTKSAGTTRVGDPCATS